jgi:MFS transporter, PPP family, 3-phenylpropionic acid transporter
LNPAQTSTRQLVPFALLSACFYAHTGFFNPYLPLWLQGQGVSLLAISSLSALQSVTLLIGPYAWGTISDHTGERAKLMLYGALAALVCSIGLWFNPGSGAGGAMQTAGLVWLGTVLFCMLMNTSVMMPMNEVATAHLVSNKGGFDGGRYGRVRLWGSMGFLLAVFAAGAWYERFGMAYLPHLTSFWLLAVVLCGLALPDFKDKSARLAEKLPIWPVLRQKPVMWFMASCFFHVLAHVGIYAFFSLYLDSLGYSKTMIGLLWAVGVMAEIGWFYTQGRWLPKLAVSSWLILGSMVMALRMGLTASLAGVLPVILLAQALHAITFAAHHSACIATLSQYFPGRLRARGQAVFTVVAYGVPGVLGGILGGTLGSNHGLSPIYWACVVVSLLAAFCAFKFRVFSAILE